MLFRPAHSIIAIPAPDKGIWAELIAVTVMLEYLFFLRCVFVILESDLPFFLNGVMDLIHAVINTLILRFGGAVHIDMPIQLAGMRFTGELTQLFNKPFAFLGRNEAGGFHRVHQQF